MTVTGIRTVSRGRCEVELDGETAFILYGAELHAYGIREDAELSEEVYETILSEVLLKRAKARSLHLLEEMDRTEYQLRRKLLDGKYPEAVVDQVVEWLYGFHYLDDLRYARNYISLKKDTRSRLQLLQDLQKRGIRAEIFESALEAEGAPDEAGQIRYWIAKKGIDPKTRDRKERGKLVRFLAGKGFRTGEILKVLDSEEQY